MLCLACGSALADATDNPYGLIRDEEFAARYAGEVEPYWFENAKVATFAAPDGLQLSYARLVVPGSKRAVVVSNGRTETYLKYKELAFDLARAGYSVYMLDHRGQGMSPRLLTEPDDHDKGHVEHFDDYVQDLRAFVQQVVRPEQSGKLFLVAHSMGGAIATRYLETYPDTFAAAALSSPMLAPNAKILLSAESSCWWFRHTVWICPTCYAGFAHRPYKHTPESLGNYTHSKERWAAVLEVFAKEPRAKLGGPTHRWASEACAVSEVMLEQAGKIRTPLLLLQAGQDVAVMLPAQNAFCERLASETGNTCNGRDGGPMAIDGASHELFIEADRYRIPAVTAILDFFAAH
jgi:lysophospholipase